MDNIFDDIDASVRTVVYRIAYIARSGSVPLHEWFVWTNREIRVDGDDRKVDLDVIVKVIRSEMGEHGTEFSYDAQTQMLVRHPLPFPHDETGADYDSRTAYVILPGINAHAGAATEPAPV